MSTKVAFIVAGVIACGCSQRPLYLPGAAREPVADLGAADLAPSSMPAAQFDLASLASPGAADLATTPRRDDLASAPATDMARAATADLAQPPPLCKDGLRLPSVPLLQPTYPTDVVASADFDGDGNLDLVEAGGSDLDILFGNGDGTFKPRVIYGALGIGFVTTDDFNGDGKPDLLVVYTTINVALNKGDGTFDRSTLSWFKGIPVGGGMTQATTGDFNHDGKRDIAAAGGDHIIVALGNGDGTFAPIVKYATGPALGSVLTGDLDGDGNPDLVAVMQNAYNSSTSSGDIGVLRGKGDGTFGGIVRYGLPSTGGSGFGALGDVNSDGKLDVLATDYKSNLVSVFLGNGDGTLRDATTFAANSVAHTAFGSDFVGAILVRDFNGDGKLDVVTTEPVGYPDYDNFVNVSLGNGDGTFQPALRAITSSDPSALTAGDFDNDGKLDLATSGYDVGVLLGIGDGTFRGYDHYASSDNPYSMTTGDFNGDGNLDIATSSYSSSDRIDLLLGNSDGRFTPGGSFAAGAWTRGIAAGDLDGDGKLDLVVTNDFFPSADAGQPYTVSVLFGDGHGRFAAPVAHAVGGNPAAVALADLDGNGALDIVTADIGTSTVSVVLGSGKRAFAPAVQYAAGDKTTGVAIGDFNHDGKLDIAASGDDTLVSLLGHGDGTFGKAVSTGYFASNQYGSYDSIAQGPLVAADFNGDGNLDLAVGGYSAGGPFPAVVVSLGQGDGTFPKGGTYAVGSYCFSITAGDLDGDGKIDLLTASNTGDDINVLLGKGDGTFAPHGDYAGGWRPNWVTTGDFNRDGRLDIATVSSGEAISDGEVNVLLNRGCH